MIDEEIKRVLLGFINSPLPDSGDDTELRFER
jgi:hypothetical protein